MTANHLQEKTPRFLAIVNPKSGGQLGPEVAKWLQEDAAQQQIELIVRETHESDSLDDLLDDVASFDRVIAAGGDGTIMQVINCIVHHKVPLAIVPSGTGNALAKALLMNLDVRQACRDAIGLDCNPLAMDLGLLNEKVYFALRLSIGYEAKVTQDTTRELKTRFGIFAYVFQALRNALYLNSIRFRFEIDGRQVKRRAESLWVANFGTLGVLGLELDPLIACNDGQLDLCAIHLGWRVGIRRVVRRLLGKQRLPADVLSRLPVRQYIKIAAAPRQLVQIDGEVVGETPCSIQCVPAAITVLLPKPVVPGKDKANVKETKSDAVTKPQPLPLPNEERR